MVVVLSVGCVVVILPVGYMVMVLHVVIVLTGLCGRGST